MDGDDENEDRGDEDGIGDVNDAVGVWVLALCNEGGSLLVSKIESLEDTLGVGGLEDADVWVFELGAVDDRMVDVWTLTGGPTREGVAPTDDRLIGSLAPFVLYGLVDEAVVVAVVRMPCVLMDPERETLVVSLVGVDGAVAVDLAVVGFERAGAVRFTGSLVLAS